MSPPWSVRMADDTPLGLLALARGSAWLVPDDGDPRPLPEGSVVLVKGPEPVTLASEPGEAVTVVCGPGGRRTAPDGADLGASLSLGARTWGNDAAGDTRVLMGCYQFIGEFSARVLAAVPPITVLTGPEFSSPLVSLLDDEIGRDEPGQQAILDKLYDLLLVLVIRAWFHAPDAVVPGWYAVFADPVVGPAVRLLHEEPNRPWTVASLAAETGQSRAALARNFTDRLGMPPMAYLKERRLTRAADLLLDPDLTLDAIARRVGYADGATLSKAFKAARGMSPQSYRADAPPALHG